MQEKLAKLMSELLTWIDELKIIMTLKSFFFGSEKGKIDIIDMIIAKEKCLFVIISINNIFLDIQLESKGKSIRWSGSLIKKCYLYYEKICLLMN